MPTTPTASTGDIQVTTSNAGEQYWANPVSLIDGGYMVFVVTTPLNNGSYSIVMQRFDNSGNKVGSEVLISSSSNSNFPSAAQLTDGTVVVAWQAANGNMFLQRVSSTGSLVGSAVDSGNTYSFGTVLPTADGGFVVSTFYNASSGRLFFYDSTATLQHTTVTSFDHLSAAVLQDGSIFSVSDANGTLYGQLYNAAGTAVGSTFDIAGSHSGNSYSRTVTLANGDVVVAWQTNGAGNSNDVAIRIFHADGSPATGDIDVVAIAGRQERPSIVALNDGGFIITWEDLTGADGGGGEGVLAQRFDASGATVGSPFVVTATTGGNQEADLFSPAQLSDGSVAFSWFGPGGGGNDAFTRVFAVDGNPSGPVSIVQSGDGGDNTLDGGSLADTLSGGSGNDHVNGGGGADTLNGDDGNDIIDGGTGADAMAGGTGNDTYYVDNSGDTVTENGAEGYDTVHSTLSYTLGANLEQLVLDGTGNTNGTGNGLGNSIVGNSGNNIVDGGDGNDVVRGGDGFDFVLGGDGNDQLFGDASNDSLTGGAGNDLLDGGAGADGMAGGTGDDAYIVDDASDLVTENAGEGNDVVKASVGFTLSADVETLILTGSGNIDGTGNSGANTLVGNAGDNVLDGGDGADLIKAGNGADTLYGGNGNDQLLGEAGDDYMLAGAGNDRLDGGDGIDNLYGDDGADIVNGGAGGDLLDGGDGADQLNGGDGNDYMLGGAGNDRLDGGAGADSMAGGTGDDIYYVDDASDLVTEAAGEGSDVVRTSVSFTLGGNIETLILDGTSNISGGGNSQANAITGNSGDNTLSGGGGNDTLKGMNGADILVGGTGNDILVGGAGADTFAILQESVIQSHLGGTVEADTISDFSTAEGDKLDLSAIDADSSAAGDQAFHLVSGFTHHAGEMTLTVVAGATTLQLDVDGDGNADYRMKINGDVHADSGGWIL
jgi:Ca2+-binding RTX toxin-like protein